MVEQSLGVCLIDRHPDDPIVAANLIVVVHRIGGQAIESPPNGPVHPALAGLDLADAVQRLDGDTALLKRLIGRFADQYVTIGERFGDYLARQDWEGGHRLAHGFKGVTKSISAIELIPLAQALETAFIEQNGMEVYRLLDLLDEPLKRVLEGANQWQP